MSLPSRRVIRRDRVYYVPIAAEAARSRSAERTGFAPAARMGRRWAQPEPNRSHDYRVCTYTAWTEQAKVRMRIPLSGNTKVFAVASAGCHKPGRSLRADSPLTLARGASMIDVASRRP